MIFRVMVYCIVKTANLNRVSIQLGYFRCNLSTVYMCFFVFEIRIELLSLYEFFSYELELQYMLFYAFSRWIIVSPGAPECLRYFSLISIIFFSGLCSYSNYICIVISSVYVCLAPWRGKNRK